MIIISHHHHYCSSTPPLTESGRWSRERAAPRAVPEHKAAGYSPPYQTVSRAVSQSVSQSIRWCHHDGECIAGQAAREGVVQPLLQQELLEDHDQRRQQRIDRTQTLHKVDCGQAPVQQAGVSLQTGIINWRTSETEGEGEMVACEKDMSILMRPRRSPLVLLTVVLVPVLLLLLG